MHLCKKRHVDKMRKRLQHTLGRFEAVTLTYEANEDFQTPFILKNHNTQNEFSETATRLVKSNIMHDDEEHRDAGDEGSGH